jgi:ABC-type glycerol-3-phosphate transport system substrate-binding protein
MLALFASDQLGDMCYGWNSQGYLASWAYKGLARALDDLVKADKYDLAQFYAGAIEADRWEGQLYALPSVGHPGEVTLFYNQNLLDAAGIKYPDITWKLDDVVEAAKKLVKPPDVWGYGWGRGYFQVVTRTRAFGGDILSPDGKKATLNTPESRAALQWEYDMIGRHRVAPSAADVPNAGQSFMDGTMGMYASNVATVTTWRKPIGERFQWAATLFPPGPSGKRGTGLHTNTLHLTKPTKHPREAWELLKHLTSHEVGVQKILMESGSPGGRPDVWNDPRLWDYAPWYKIGAALMAEAKPPFVAYNLRTPEVSTAMEQALPDIWNSKVSPATGADQITQALQAILDQPR